MIRNTHSTEIRDEMIAELTGKHFTRRLGALVSGNNDAVRSVDEALSHLFCDKEVMGQLIMLATTDRYQAGAKLEQLIHDVLRVDAEVDALREVEQQERQRKESQHEGRIAQAEMDRSMGKTAT